MTESENEKIERPGTGNTPETGVLKAKKKRRRRIRRILWIFVILVVLSAAGYVGYSKLKSDYTIVYEPYTATRGSISNSLSFSGTMQLIDSKTYTAASDGKIREVYVRVGDHVEKGDRLYRLSSKGIVEAEFAGTVNAVNIAQGDEVLSGESLLSIADFDRMRVTIRVGESDIASVYTGQPCRITVASAEASYDSVIQTIDYISYTGNNVAYYTTTVEVDTSGTQNIYPGMQATVTVPLEEAADVIILKMEALSTARDNTAFVYKETAEGEMTEVPVTVGVSNGNYVEIRSGLSEGETIYRVAEKEETASGLASLFSGLFTNRQVNRQTNNWDNRNNNGGGSMTRNNNNGTQPGGSRGN